MSFSSCPIFFNILSQGKPPCLNFPDFAIILTRPLPPKFMKRKLYIALFIVLGIILQFIIHAVVENWYIGFLVKDFAKYGLGLSWDTWFLIHHVATVILVIAGIIFGYFQGKYWWRRIYGGTD